MISTKQKKIVKLRDLKMDTVALPMSGHDRGGSVVVGFREEGEVEKEV